MVLLEIVEMIIEMIIEETLIIAVKEDDMMIMEEIPNEQHMIVVLLVQNVILFIFIYIYLYYERLL